MKRQYVIRVQRFAGSAQLDNYNNEIESWGDPVDDTVLGCSRATTEERSEDGHNRLVVVRTLLTRTDSFYNERDRFILPDEPDAVYEVDGIHVRADRNPFGWNPGGQLVIRRVDG